MDDYRYTYAVARVNVLGIKLLDRSLAARMLAAEPQEILRMLGETAYAESFAGIQDLAEVDQALIDALAKTYDLLWHISPEKEPINLFRRRYDFHNLKALLKSQATGVPTNGSLINLGTYDLEKLTAAVSEKAYRFTPDYIRETALEASAEYAKTQKVYAISYVCDSLMWRHLLDLAQETQNQLVIDLIKKYVDFANIKSFLRVKEFSEDRDILSKYYIPGGSQSLPFLMRHIDEQLGLFISHLDKTGDERRILSEGLAMWPEDKSFWRLELAIDNFILRWFYRLRTELFSIAPLIYYLLRKESDAKFIRAVIKCKLIGMPRPQIEERARFLYV